MSNTDLWIYGDEGCLQKFDAEHCEANRTRTLNSRNQYIGSANLKDGYHCLDVHKKGEVLREQNDLNKTKDSDVPNMFRKGFGILSVKPIRESSKNRDKRLSKRVPIENLSDLLQDKSQCAIVSENIKDDEVVFTVPSDKVDIACASKFSQEETREAHDLRINDKSIVSKNHLITGNTHATEDSDTISTPGGEAVTSSQCNSIAVQRNHSYVGNQSKVQVLDFGNYLSTTMAEGDMQASSIVHDDDLLVKSSMTEENTPVGSAITNLDTLDTLPPVKTPTSISAVGGLQNDSTPPSDVIDSSDAGRIPACVPHPKSSSDCDIASVIGSPASVSQMPLLADEKWLVEYRSEVSPATQFKSTCLETDLSPTSVSQGTGKCTESPLTQLEVNTKSNQSDDFMCSTTSAQMSENSTTSAHENSTTSAQISENSTTSAQMSESDSFASWVYQQNNSVSTTTVEEPNGLVCDEMVDRSGWDNTGLIVSAASEKELSNTESDPVGIPVSVPDLKYPSACDTTSVIGSPGSVSQMSILANENSLIKYLTDVPWTTRLMSARLQTDVGPPSMSRKSRKRSEGTLTSLEGKTKRKKSRNSKSLKHRVNGMSKMTPKTFLAETCSDSLKKSTESMCAGENTITTASANNLQHESTEFGINRIKTEPSNNDEYSAAILGNTFGIKSEPLDNDEYSSAQSLNKDYSSKLLGSCHTCQPSLSKPATETLTDGATKIHEPTFDTSRVIPSSNGLSKNVSFEKSCDTKLPKISSVFTLRSHKSMSLQELVDFHERHQGDSISEGTRSEIGSDYTNSKNLYTIKYPKEMKNDPRLRSLCRVVLEKMRMKDGRVISCECTKTCRQRFLSTKMKSDIARNRRNHAKNVASYMRVIPQMKMRRGFYSSGLEATGCQSSLPEPAIIRVVNSSPPTYVSPVGQLPNASCSVPYEQCLRRPPLHSFPGVPKGYSDKRKYYMFNVQGRNIVIPSVRLDTPRIIPYHQSLKRLTKRSFPGMQLGKTSLEHQPSDSSDAPKHSIKTKTKSQSTNTSYAAKPGTVAETFTENLRLSYLPGFKQCLVKKTLCVDEDQ